MKKIMVLGGTGQIGSRVVNQLLEKGYEVYPASRHAKESFKEQKNLHPVRLDVTKPLSDIKKVVKDFDAIIDTIGSMSNPLETMAYGQVKVMQAAKENGIKRFVKLSGIGEFSPESKPSVYYSEMGYRDTVLAIYFADNYLSENSKLDWTIVRAVDFSSEPGNWKVSLSKDDNDVFPGTISMDDLATTLVDCLEDDQTTGIGFAISDGTSYIEDALQNIK